MVIFQLGNMQNQKYFVPHLASWYQYQLMIAKFRNFGHPTLQVGISTNLVSIPKNRTHHRQWVRYLNPYPTPPGDTGFILRLMLLQSKAACCYTGRPARQQYHYKAITKCLVLNTYPTTSQLDTLSIWVSED